VPASVTPLQPSSPLRVAALAASLLTAAWCHGHDLHGDSAHPHYDRSVRPPDAILPSWHVAQATPPAAPSTRPAQAEAFARFAPKVTLRWDASFLYVEGRGLPDHGMMTGITAWQQQVPLPQPYVGPNAWRIPLQPVPARQPQSIRDRFLRGAIALAANGIPIFNPQNNRGEISQDIGELDQWGGHCGRADDYHYHAAPLHLQAKLGLALPIAYALDGYAIYGLTEPDGSQPAGLDSFNGHTTAELGYHYHGSLKYPFVNGGFHGEVLEREGQVDPQPRAQSVRPALTALRGARITGFTLTPDERQGNLQYTVNGRNAGVSYAANADGSWKFHFTNADGATRDETYRPGGGRGGGSGDPKGKGKGRKGPPPAPGESRPLSQANPPGSSGAFALRSPAIGDDHVLPTEFTGDGASLSPPLEWTAGPAGTHSYALIMHHLTPDGDTKWYWTLYNIPADTRSLPKDSRDIGTLGNNSVSRRVGYAPPRSQGPGAKTYILTLYALSAPLQLDLPAAQVNRDVLLTALQPVTLASTQLEVTYTRPPGALASERPRGEKGGPGQRRPPSS
jgi:phosphatidylethanolamine-binding protein (PEBP) family uncharacterized protein